MRLYNCIHEVGNLVLWRCTYSKIPFQTKWTVCKHQWKNCMYRITSIERSFFKMHYYLLQVTEYIKQKTNVKFGVAGFDSYQDVPLDEVMIWNRFLVCRPKRAPKANASAADAIWTPASSWLTILTQLQKRVKKKKKKMVSLIICGLPLLLEIN